MNKLKKVFVAALAVIIALLSFLGIRSCSQAPTLEEVEGRLAELIEASYGVNEILFGKGPAVYEKVYENKFIPHRIGEDIYYYYTLNDATIGEMFALKTTDVYYFVAEDEARDGESAWMTDTEGRYFYETEYEEPEGFSDAAEVKGPFDNAATTEAEKYYFYFFHDEALGKDIYRYSDTQGRQYLIRSEEEREGSEPTYTADGYFYYEIEYTEPSYEMYYRESDPDGYSYVRMDSPYYSAEAIKLYAESVYSRGYLSGVYEMLFTGAAISDSDSGIRGARYYNYEDSDGKVWLMSADDYESLIPGKRIYDLSTARIVRPRRRDFVNIEIESYLEGQPDVRVKVKLSMIKQDGVWMLDSATY